MCARGCSWAAVTLSVMLWGCAPPAQRVPVSTPVDPATWRTVAERSDHRETGHYDEAIEFCRRLADASPYAHYEAFGRSGEGRDLPLLILSRDGAFTPAAARRAEKPVVLVQNCIHAGECEGKDACLAMARDMLIAGTQADLLDHVTLVIIPIFNVDGHERRSPYSRANQNGPVEMGWRTTAINLNLNRDYVKADAPEMQAWLKLWTAWQPDLFIDNHTTDGEEHRYDVFYTLTWEQDVAEPVAAWMRSTLAPGVLPVLTAEGYDLLPYCWLRDRKDPAAGIVAMMPQSPRLSTGYGAACNRPSILVETHARQPYGRRVQATYAFLQHVLEVVNGHGDGLRAAVRAADATSVANRGANGDRQVPLRFEPNGETRKIVYRGYELRLYPSEVTGDTGIEYTTTPKDTETTLSEHSRVTVTVTPPLAYVIPPQWDEVIRRLDWHGIRYERLRAADVAEVESYRFEDVTFAPEPYEGRQIPRFKTVAVHEQRSFPAGTAIVPLDQARAKLAVHLLEPAGPDSLVVWGLFNAIFEQKEYAEAYIMEPLARRMLAEDAVLRAEFEAKLRADEAFAKSPNRRLDFFYRHSQFRDDHHNVYPVARVENVATLRRLLPPP